MLKSGNLKLLNEHLYSSHIDNYHYSFLKKLVVFTVFSWRRLAHSLTKLKVHSYSKMFHLNYSTI